METLPSAHLLRNRFNRSEDFQYILAVQEGALVFRITSVLGDYITTTSSGLLVPQRAILTHFRDQFGGFTQDEIEELEEMLNSPTASEADFQPPKLIRRQKNRDRFAASLIEARAQLLRYRDWFRERQNRDNLRTRVGMEIYEPQLIVIIGRSSEFRDEFDRQQIYADYPDIDVVTYDDILTFAKRRRMVIEG